MEQCIILAGGGHAHLAVLSDWAEKPFPHTTRWLVTSSRYATYSGMLPGWMEGIYRAEDLTIDLKPIAEKAGARLVIAEVIGIDPDNKSITLSSGETMAFDLLSLAVGGESNVSNLAALGDRLLPVRPVGEFVERWSIFTGAFDPGSTDQVVIVGGGAAGVELALGAAALIHRMSDTVRVSIASSRDGFLSGHTPRTRNRVLKELNARHIGVHLAHAAGTESGLLLSDGTNFAADLVIAATGSRAPRWLARSGLACNASGFVTVGADMRSTSHPWIFAAGDIVNMVDRHLDRSGVHAVKSGPVLAANLRATVDGSKPLSYRPRHRTLYLLALGNRRAIGTWGSFVATGHWVWRIKDWIDRRFVRKYAKMEKS